MRFIAIDDEPPALEVLAEFAQRSRFLESVGSFNDAHEGLEFILNHRSSFDFAFMDINMPGINGFDILESVKSSLPVIIVSAYSEFAIDSFKFETIGYLTKPVEYKKFYQSVLKMREHLRYQGKESPFFIKDGTRILKIDLSQVIYLQAYGNYVKVYDGQDFHTVHTSLIKIIDLLPNHFLRIHKSYIVNTQLIKEIYGNTIVLKDGELPIGRNYREDLIRKFNIN